MNTPIESRQINAFVDGELDLASQLEMEERLRRDGPLREQVNGLRQLRETIREGADYHASPAALRKRIASSVAPQRPPAHPPAAAAVAAAVQRWFVRRRGAASGRRGHLRGTTPCRAAAEGRRPGGR